MQACRRMSASEGWRRWIAKLKSLRGASQRQASGGRRSAWHGERGLRQQQQKHHGQEAPPPALPGTGRQSRRCPYLLQPAPNCPAPFVLALPVCCCSPPPASSAADMALLGIVTRAPS